MRHLALSEELEPRILLSVDAFYTAEASADLTLRIENNLGVETLKVIDDDLGDVQSAALSEITGPVRIVGSSFDDSLRVELSAAVLATKLPGGVLFEGGAGNDTLVGSDGDTTWNVTGANAGNVDGVGMVDFSGVENLVGAADNEDTFVFAPGGSLAGGVDGGAAGFDTLVIEGGSYQNLLFTASGPDSGTVALDGNIIAYVGLEPITVGGTAANAEIDLSDLDTVLDASNDDATLMAGSPGQLTFESTSDITTFESLNFNNPTNSLTIILGRGDDVLHIQSLDSAFAAALTVEGQEGEDAVFIEQDLSLPGENLSIDAETIGVGFAVGDQTEADDWTPGAMHTGVSQASTTGSGTGMSVDIAVDADGVPTVSLVSAGTGYAVDDEVTFNDPDGGGTAVTVTVLSSGDLGVDVSTRQMSGGVSTGNSGDIMFGGFNNPTVDHTSDEGSVEIETGEIVHIVDPFLINTFSGTGTVGNLYQYVAVSPSPTTIDLTSEDYTTSEWDDLGPAVSEAQTAKKIIIGQQSQLLAEVTTGSFTPGAVFLKVEEFAGTDAFDIFLADTDESVVGISVLEGASVKGGAVDFQASADHSRIIDGDGAGNAALNGLVGILETFSLIGGVAISKTDASIDVGVGTNIVADTFSAIAEGTTDARTSPIAIQVAVAVAIADNNARVHLAGNITTTGDVFVRAGADNTLDARADASATFVGFAVGVAVTVLDSNATAHVADTASLDVGGDLTVRADTVDRNVTLARSVAGEEGFLGVAVAVSDEEGETNALLDGTADVDGDVRVQAFQRKEAIHANRLLVVPSLFTGVAATSGVGTDSKGQLLDDTQGAATTTLLNKLKEKIIGKSDEQQSGSASGQINAFDLSAGVAVVTDVNNATARIGDGAGSDRGVVTVPSGSIEVHAKIENRPDVTAGSESSAPESASGGSSSSSPSKFGGSAAVAVGDYENNAEAYIGDGAQVDASEDLTVKAEALNDFEFSFFTNLFVTFNNPDIDHTTDDGSVGVQPADVVRVKSGFSGTGDVGNAYKFIGENPLTINLNSENFTNGNRWEDLGALDVIYSEDGSVVIEDGDLVRVSPGHEDGGEVDDIYQYVGDMPGSSIDLSMEDFTDEDNWENVGADAWKLRSQTFVENLTTYLDSNLGLDNNVVDSWTQATAQDAEISIAGAVTVLSLKHTAQAYIDENALINQNTTDVPRSGQQNVIVEATSVDEAVHFGGNIELPGIGGSTTKFTIDPNFGGLGTTGGKAAMGATVLIVNYDDTVKAEIRDDAEVYGDTLQVLASNTAMAVSVTGSGGESGNFGFNGVFSLFDFDHITYAQIENGADVSVGSGVIAGDPDDASVVVEAVDDSRIYNIAGGVVATKGVGVGAAIAINEVSRDTRALIGNLNLPDTIDGGEGDNAGNASTADKPTGGDTTLDADGNVRVNAENKGVVVAVSLSASVASQASGSTSQSQSAPQSGGNFGLSVSANVSVNEFDDKTLAYVHDAVVEADDLNISATNDTDIWAIAGSVAVTTTQNSGASLAGAYTQNTLDSTTQALVDNSDVDLGTNDFAATATTTGSIVSIGVSGAVSTSSNSGSLAGQVTNNSIASDTRAGIRNSSDVTADDVDIQATDTSGIFSIAGAIAFGGKLGVAGSVALNDIPDGGRNKVLAYVENSDVDADDIRLVADSNSNIFAITAAVAGSSGGFAGAGAVSINTISVDTQASIKGKKTSQGVDADDSVSLTADDTSDIFSIAGGVAIGSEAGIGASIAKNDIDSKPKAYIDNSAVVGADDLTLASTLTGTILNVAAGFAGGKTLAIGGSVSINEINDESEAYIKNSTVTVDNNISLTTSQDAEIGVIAGAIGIASTASFGAAVAVNTIGTESDPNLIRSYIESSKVVSSSGTLTMSATSDSVIKNITVAGTFGGTVSANGSVSVNNINNHIESFIKDSQDTGTKLVSADGNISLTATDNAAVSVIAGSIAVSGTAGGGAAVSIVNIGHTIADIDQDTDTSDFGESSDVGAAAATNVVRAYIENSEVTSSNGVISLTATTNSIIFNIAAGIGVGGTVGLTGSIAINNVNSDIAASISSNSIVTAKNDVDLLAQTVNRTDLPAGALGRSADDTSESSFDGDGAGGDDARSFTSIQSIAGGVAGGGTAGVGVALATNNIAQKVKASISGSTVTSNEQDVELRAISQATIETLSAAIGAAGTFAAVGAISLNNIDNDVQAFISGGSVTSNNTSNTISSSNTPGIFLSASDTSTIKSLSGQIAVSGGGSIGASATYNEINNTIKAYVDGDATLTTSGNVVLSAVSNSTIETLAVGGSFGIVGVGGSVAINLIGNTVEAYIDGSSTTGSTVTADDNVVLLADSNNTIVGNAGSIAGGAVGIGGAVVVNILDNVANAFVNHSSVVAKGNGNSISIKTWDSNSGDESTESIKGLAIIATNFDNVDVIAVTASIGAAGVSGNVSVTSVNDATQAYIAASTVNSASHYGERVIVRAHQDIDVDPKGGALSAGGVAAAAGVDTVIIKNTTRAFISDADEDSVSPDPSPANSTVYGRGVEVSTQTRERVDPIIAGASISGGLSLAGSISVVEIESTNDAFIKRSDVYSVGTLKVRADDIATITTFVGSISGSLGASAGASVAVNSIENTTRARVLGAHLNATGATEVIADTDETITTVAATGAAGFGAGIAGAVSVNTIENTAEAIVERNGGRNAHINQDSDFQPGGANTITTGQTVTIEANDDATIDGTGGALGAGLAAGIGATIDIGTIKNRTVAKIGDRSDVFAQGNIEIEAFSNRDMDSDVAAFSGGLLGLSGAISVLSMGAPPDTTSELPDDDNTGGSSEEEFDSSARSDINDDIDLDLNEVDTNDGTASTASSRINGMSDPSITDDLGSVGSDRITAAFVDDAGSAANGAEIVSGAGSITVRATTQYDVDVDAGQISVGVVGLGGSIAIVTISNVTQAYVGDHATLEAGTDITVRAFDNQVGSESTIDTFAGNVGIVGAGGAYARLDVSTDTDAYLGEDVEIRDAGAVSISAEIDADVDSDGEGISAGLVAAGAIVTETEVTGSIKASIGTGTVIGSSSTPVGSLTVEAISNVTAESESEASSVGLVGGAGATSGATIDVDVDALVGDPGIAASGVMETDLPLVDVHATGDIEITADATHKTLANADGFAAGVGAAGFTTAVASMQTLKTRARTGTGVSLTSDQDVLLQATSDHRADVDAVGGVGGLVGVGAATSSATLVSDTEAIVGDKNSITAQDGRLDILSENTATISATSQQDLGALGGDNETEASATVNADALSEIGETTEIDVDILLVEAKNKGKDQTHNPDVLADTPDSSNASGADGTIDFFAEALTRSESAAAQSFNDATSTVNSTTHSKVMIGGGNTNIIAATSATLRAREENVRTRTQAKTTATGLGGSAESTSSHTKNSLAEIETDAQSDVTTVDFLAEANADKADQNNFVEELVSDLDTVADLALEGVEGVVTVGGEIVCAWGLFCDPEGAIDDGFDAVRSATGQSSQTITSADLGITTPIVQTEIDFHTDITIGAGAQPYLEIDPTGEVIAKTDQITVKNQLGTVFDVGDTFAAGDDIIVDPIINDIEGSIRIDAEDSRGSLTGHSVFDFKTSFDSVTIINASDHDLYINDIEVSNPNPSEPAITLIPGAVTQRIPPSAAAGITFTYETTTNGESSVVDISNTMPIADVTDPRDIWLRGHIENQGGITLISNASGDILSEDQSGFASTNSYVRTRELELTTLVGSVGRMTGGGAIERLFVRMPVSFITDRPNVEADGNAGVYLNLTAGTGDGAPIEVGIGTVGEADGGDVDMIRSLSGDVDILFSGAVRVIPGPPSSVMIVDATLVVGDVSAGGDITIVGLAGSSSKTDIELTGTLSALNGTVGIGSARGNILSGDTTHLIEAENIDLRVDLQSDGMGGLEHFTGSGRIGTPASSPAEPIRIDLQGSTGQVDATASGDVVITEVSGNMRIGLITSDTGRATLTSLTGALRDTFDAGAKDIEAPEAVLVAATGIGTSSNPLETMIDTLEADGGTGGIFIDNMGDLQIGGIGTGGISPSGTGMKADGEINLNNDPGSITVVEAVTSAANQVNMTSRTDININEVVSSGGDDVNLGASDNNLNVNAMVTSSGGDVFGSAKYNVSVNAAILTSGGDVDLDADHDIIITSIGSIDTTDTNGGVVDLDALHDILVNGPITSDGAEVNLNAGNDVTLDDDTGNNGSIDSSGSGGPVILIAGVDILVDGPIVTGGGNVTAMAGNDITVDDSITTSGGTVDMDATRDVVVTTNGSIDSGNALVDVDAGRDININQGGLVDSAGGTVELHATDDVDVSGTILSDGGTVDVLADDDITFGSTGLIDTESGGPTVTITADADGTAGGGITMADGSQIDATDGLIDVDATDNIIVSLLVTTTDVTVDSSAGALLDTNDAASIDFKDIISDTAVLHAATGIGSATNPLETMVNYLEADGGSGGIWINDMGGLVIGDVDASVNGLRADGPIVVSTTDLPLEVREDVVSRSAGGVGNNVTLDALESSSLTDDDEDFLLTNGATIDGLNVTLRAGDDLHADSDTHITADNTITLRGDHGNADPGIGTLINLNGHIAATDVFIHGEVDDDVVELHLQSLAGHTRVFGDDSNSATDDGKDLILVDELPSLDKANRGNAGRDTLDLDGEGDTDTYIININADSTTDYLINVLDTGARDDGTDTLTINGLDNAPVDDEATYDTEPDDTFLLRREFVAHLEVDPSSDAAFTDDVERINYDVNINGRLRVNSLGGHDGFFSDDNSSITTLDGGDDNDLFQIGQVFGTDPNVTAGVAPGDEIAVTEITRGFLSAGISLPLVAYGGTGADTFSVYSNKAVLRLEGESGNDTFVVRAFVLAGTETSTSEETTELNGGEGEDFIQYNVNAQVSIDGGDGTDTVVVVGSELDDAFVITDEGVFGAGLNVSISNTEEQLEIDGLEGDDHFFILSTLRNAVTTVIGGLGSDTFSVTGDVTETIISAELEGRSGVINHSVMSDDGAFDGVLVEGIALNVADEARGKVVLQESDGFSEVREDVSGSVDTYTVSMSVAAADLTEATIAYLTVSAAQASTADAALALRNPMLHPAATLLVSSDGIHFLPQIVLRFDSSDSSWDSDHTVYVKATSDDALEGERTVTISHSMLSDNDDFNLVAINNVEVKIVDDDKAGLILTQLDGATSDDETKVLEGGFGDSYEISLTHAPATGETVTVTLDVDSQLLASSTDTRFASGVITFDSTNWDSPVVIDLAADDDGTPENELIVDIVHNVTSTDTAFVVVDSPVLEVTVLDDDSAGVLITETDGSTLVVVGGGSDFYDIVLIQQPTDNVIVKIHTDGQTLVTSSDSRFDLFDDPSTMEVEEIPGIEFTPLNWNVPATIQVDADPDFDPTGPEFVKTFPIVAHTTSTLRGPLVIEGGVTDADRSLRVAVMLPTEDPTPPGDIEDFTDETQQTDTLLVFNDSSVSDDNGTMAYRTDITNPALTITGLGMSDDLTLDQDTSDTSDDVTVSGGITLNGLEIVEVLLGIGNDTFTVEDTLEGAITAIHGGGNSEVSPGVIGGDTIIVNGGGGPSSPLVVFGDTSQDGSRYDSTPGVATGRAIAFDHPGNDTVDASALSFSTAVDVGLTIYGGPANDLLIGSQAGDHIAGGSGADTIGGEGGPDHLYGDSGFNVDLSTRIDLATLVLTVPTTPDAGNDAPNQDDLTPGDDTIRGDGGNDIILGDHGIITQTAGTLRILTTGEVVRSETTTDLGGADDTILGGDDRDLLFGGEGDDDISGGGGHDILIGDYGLIVDDDANVNTLDTVQSTDPALGGEDTIRGGPGNDILLGGDGDDRLFGGEGASVPITGSDFDIVLGDNATLIDVELLNASTTAEHRIGSIATTDVTDATGGADRIEGNEDDDVLLGGVGNDSIDGNQADDLILGDGGVLTRRTLGETSNPRFRGLLGTRIYGEDIDTGIDGKALVDFGAQFPNPSGAPKWANWVVTVDPGFTQPFGNDYLAGGPQDDQIFGQQGNDVIQGDGSIDESVGATRDPSTGLLVVDPSVEATSDGDDYIEGNAGNDVVFGNLGQDDILGGSSELFGLDTAAKRTDGSDLIFGGAGTNLLRNNAGDLSPVGHARDADNIAADNGNIFRLVINTPGASNFGQYLAFNYDNYPSTLRIIPRAVDLLDYTPGGADFDATAADDIGAADEVHGESGDDTAYGTKGDDILFGEGQDDDLIGGYGNDILFGGAGEDGILGDDGRIYTSRNTERTNNNDTSLAEPLYGIDKLDEVDQEISTPGDVHQATINIDGRLKKTVNLAPFNVDPFDDPLFDPDKTDADDIVYGGLGDDFLHGGAGDDALSGAEALPLAAAIVYPDDGTSDPARTDGVVYLIGYDRPVNPGNVLSFEALRAEEFATYDEFNPRQKIQIVDGGTHEFFLNFDNPSITPDDGSDVLFGDLGNDWLVGGTGRDNLYGGRGNDLLNADDDLETNMGANDAPDPADGDFAYGGAGRDVLIANTGADRLIDWTGEFNSYIVPFGPFGVPTISRGVPPQLFEFLYDLSASDGADPTRAQDTGNAAERNGEPDGELGLVIQKDADWQAQTGAPDDPQPGNIPGGARDTVQSANFNFGQAQGFVPDAGTWEVSNGRYQVAPETPGGDAVSVYYVDHLLPVYFELKATINAGKPTAGYKSNAYMVFDYQGPDDFKFAGVNISTDKLEMGRRTAEGWIVDEQTPAQLKPDTDYDLLLAINGSTGTLVIDNTAVFTHTYAARVDADGFSYGLNLGLVGLGATNSKARIDNVAVQVLPPEITLEETEDFTEGSADIISAPISGQWAIAADRYEGSPAPGNDLAISLVDLEVGPAYLARLEPTLSTETVGGVVFDLYGPEDFKFAAISAETGQVVIGHNTSRRGWSIDAVADRGIVAGSDYDMVVTLTGTTVSVMLNNQVVLGYAFNALVTDGAYGLLSQGGSSSFSEVTISTNDPAYLEPAGETLLYDTQATSQDTGLTGAELDRIVDEAVRRWADSGQVDGAARLADIPFYITDLPSSTLGQTDGQRVWIDVDAAGNDWFIDPTPGQDDEFSSSGLWATPASDAYGHVDLLSVVLHEFGHVLGFEHGDPNGLMGETLSTGMRRLPESNSPALPGGENALLAVSSTSDAGGAGAIPWLGGANGRFAELSTGIAGSTEAIRQQATDQSNTAHADPRRQNDQALLAVVGEISDSSTDLEDDTFGIDRFFENLDEAEFPAGLTNDLD